MGPSHISAEVVQSHGSRPTYAKRKEFCKPWGKNNGPKYDKNIKEIDTIILEVSETHQLNIG